MSLQVSTGQGGQLLWDMKAPEMLRKGWGQSIYSSSFPQHSLYTVLQKAERPGLSCRYETEEDPEVCATMERIAHLFLADSGAVEDSKASEDIDIADKK